jgi:ComF family protein
MAFARFARLQNAVRDVAGAGLTLLFPPKCVGCGRVGELFCAHCAQAVEPAPPTTTPSPQLAPPNPPALRVTHAAALHSAPLREAIHAFKYRDQPELAPLLARYLVAAYAAPPWATIAPPITAVVPVPLHAQRLAVRGYNQAELLAQHFCRAVGLPLQPAWLTRTRETRMQVGLGPRERQANVENAFVASPAMAGARVLLIDDVYTTGATLHACAAAARQAGARVVYGLTLAQPVRRTQFAPVNETQADMPDLPWWEGDV